MKRTRLKDRELPNYTKGEEIFNMVTHIVGVGLGVAVLVLSIVIASIHGSVAGILTGIVFGMTMILLYVMSAIYHGLSANLMAKKVFQVMDHCTIFLLIAGTYTPITVCSIVPVDPVLGWMIFSVVWVMAVIGVILNAIDIKRFKVFSMIAYIGMGWCVIGSLGKILEIFSVLALWLLIGGGVAYTVGAVLYVVGKKLRYMHSVFHIFVLIGSIMQALMILIYVL